MPLAGFTLTPVIAIVGVRSAMFAPNGTSRLMFVPTMVPSTPRIVNVVMSFVLLCATTTVTVYVFYGRWERTDADPV